MEELSLAEIDAVSGGSNSAYTGGGTSLTWTTSTPAGTRAVGEPIVSGPAFRGGNVRVVNGGYTAAGGVSSITVAGGGPVRLSAMDRP